MKETEIRMSEIVPGTTDAAVEKHVPVWTVENGIVHVKVGSVEHPDVYKRQGIVRTEIQMSAVLADKAVIRFVIAHVFHSANL